MNNIQRTLTKMLLLCLGAVTINSVAAKSLDYGQFRTGIKTQWNNDGISMTLLEDVVYIDAKGLEWVAKAGRKIDGASIPPFAWGYVAGSPYRGRFRDASVIHDVFCEDGKKGLTDRTWQAVHRNFYEAMLASDVSRITAKIMFKAVYHGGPKWEALVSTLVEPAREMRVEIPAEYRTETVTEVVRPAGREWKPEDKLLPNDRVLQSRPGPAGSSEVLVDVPAEYKTVKMRVLEKPASFRIDTIPARYEEVQLVPPEELTETEFAQLARAIETAERSETPMTLDEIENLAPLSGAEP